MGDLKTENVRLQRLADVLDSQPELTIVIDKDGKITYISERALNYMKYNQSDESEDDPSHINQILTPESVETVLECIAQVRADNSCINNLNGDQDGSMSVSSVKVNFLLLKAPNKISTSYLLIISNITVS